MVINNLFPQAIATFELGRDLSKTEQEYLFNLETRPNQGNTTSIDSNVLDKPELNLLAEFLNNSLQEYFNSVYAPKNNPDLCITQSWVNYTKQGQFHHKHTHANSIVSGVFYIQAIKDVDRLYFFKDGYQQIKIPAQNFNVYNSESWWFDAVTGGLILFPSSTPHMVDTVKSEETRISLSFNTFPKGVIGEELGLTSLKLG